MSRPEGDDAAGGGFFDRWARRKQESRSVADKAAQAPAPEAAGALAQEAAGEPALRPAAPVAATADGDGRARDDQQPLPSLDDILPGSDIKAFLQPHVPEALRMAALRKLWVTDPTIRNFIEMADYQWDFTNPDSIPGWSSTLEGVDVEAMVESIFKAVKPMDAPKPPAAMAAEPSPGLSQADDGPAAAVAENTDTTTIPDASGAAATKGEVAGAADCAVQNSPSESSVYEPLRRRHGGALPT
jgi:hypothetical protein